MGDKTAIEWADSTWNPIRGCSKVSEGCRNCYAMGVAARFSGPGQPYEGLAKRTPEGPQWTNKVVPAYEMLERPLHWAKPRRIFVNSMSDLFHTDVPFGYIDLVFGVMSLCTQHTFQILTKRPERMREYLADYAARVRIDARAKEIGPPQSFKPRYSPILTWPLPNVWLGTSVEDQASADNRIPELTACPAAVRFLSCEPLLGPVTLWHWDEDEAALRGPGIIQSGGMTADTPYEAAEGYDDSYPGIDWVIVGGESGPKARPMHPEWARSLRNQCQASGVPFFFKQWGEWVPFVTELHYLAGSLLPGNSEIIGGDCGGPHNLQNFKKDGTCLARLRDGLFHNVKHRRENDHRWGKDNLQVMEYLCVGKKAAGRLLDGRTWDEMPEVVPCE